MMAQVIRSGAFLQQCWSVHPLCVTVKRLADERTLVLTCSACKSAHHLSVGLVTPKDAVGQEPGREAAVEGGTLLTQCVAGHPSAITLREMDVFQDLVLLRCGDCRRLYEVTVSSFETRQR